MITTNILNFFYNFIWFITSPLRGLTDVTIPTGLSSAVEFAGDYLGLSYQVLPATTVIILGVLTSVLIYELAYFTYKGIMWITRRIPGQG